MKHLTLQKLKDDMGFRERRSKDKGLAEIINEKYQVEINDDIVFDILTGDRYWRKHLEDNENLRGKDYKDGRKYSQKKQIDLGYEAGYDESVKKMKIIMKEGKPVAVPE